MICSQNVFTLTTGTNSVALLLDGPVSVTQQVGDFWQAKLGSRPAQTLVAEPEWAITMTTQNYPSVQLAVTQSADLIWKEP